MGKKLGDYIRTVRKEKGISLEKLADLSNLPVFYLHCLEEGEEQLRIFVAPKLAVALDVPMEIIKEIEKEEELLEAMDKIRNATRKTATNKKALARIEKELLTVNNATSVANYIVNADLRAIVRATSYISDADLKKLRRLVEVFLTDTKVS